jgi:hypothetical protein
MKNSIQGYRKRTLVVDSETVIKAAQGSLMLLSLNLIIIRILLFKKIIEKRFGGGRPIFR